MLEIIQATHNFYRLTISKKDLVNFEKFCFCNAVDSIFPERLQEQFCNLHDSCCLWYLLRKPAETRSHDSYYWLKRSSLCTCVVTMNPNSSSSVGHNAINLKAQCPPNCIAIHHPASPTTPPSTFNTTLQFLIENLLILIYFAGKFVLNSFCS